MNSIKEVIKHLMPVLPDPRKCANGTMYYSQISRNNKLYNIDVLYDSFENKIFYFKYTDRALGPLKKRLNSMIFRGTKYLYILINYYLDQKINEKTFCDEFYKSFDLGENSSDLDKLEEKIFDELGIVVGRYTAYGQDLNELPHFFYNKNQLAEKILETKTALMKIHPEYFA